MSRPPQRSVIAVAGVPHGTAAVFERWIFHIAPCIPYVVAAGLAILAGMLLWVATDRRRRADFNAVNVLIAIAIAAVLILASYRPIKRWVFEREYRQAGIPIPREFPEGRTLAPTRSQEIERWLDPPPRRPRRVLHAAGLR